MTKQTECVLDFDEARYPLIYITHRGQMTLPAMERSLLCYKRYLARALPFALVFDAREALRPPSEPMQRLTDLMKAEEEKFGLYCKGIAYVLDSVLIRMVVRSIFLVQRPPFPWSVHEHPASAEQWCLSHLPPALHSGHTPPKAT